MHLLKYFDLNQRSKPQWHRQRVNEQPEHLIQQWFSPNPANQSSKRRHSVATKLWVRLTQQEDGQLSIAEQVLMYFGILLGVYFSGLIRGQSFQPTLWLAAFTALVIIPIVFEKLSVNPRAPLVVRFGLFVQNGVFWDVLLQAIGGINR